jgi:hypothetical protein
MGLRKNMNSLRTGCVEPGSSRIEDSSFSTGAILFSQQTLHSLHSYDVAACNLYIGRLFLMNTSFIVRVKNTGKNVGLHESV